MHVFGVRFFRSSMVHTSRVLSLGAVTIAISVLPVPDAPVKTNELRSFTTPATVNSKVR